MSDDTKARALSPLTMAVMRAISEAGRALTVEEIVKALEGTNERASDATVRGIAYCLLRYGRAEQESQVAGSRAMRWTLTQKGRTELHEFESGDGSACPPSRRHVALAQAWGMALRPPASATKARVVDLKMDVEPQGAWA